MTPPHAVQFYNDDVFLIDTVSAFITAGLKENGAIIVIATAQHREELRNALQSANNSSITYIDAVELISAFMVDDWPNETRFTSTVGPLLQRAALKGPVRIFSEMAVVLWTEGKTRAAIRLEELGNELASQHAFSLLCAYPMSGFPDQKNNLSFLQVCRAHTHVQPAQ